MTENKEILFGGTGPSALKIPEFKKSEGRKTWDVVLEGAGVQLTSTDEGKQLYGDPQKGATLEQAWRASGLFTGRSPVCLLATGKSPVATDAIKRVVKMNQQNLVSTLADILKLSDNTAAQVFYHDGNMGHCITLLKYDTNTSRFNYHDPWPGDSLLCKEYNAAGIDAQQTGKNWSITSAELEKVIFAAFIFQNLWAEYMGEKYYITYDEFKGSDFWSFFHITEADTQLQDNNDMLKTLKTKGFQSEIDLQITLSPKQRLRKGQLNVKRSWVTGPPYGLNPFALDIVRSFIAVLTPPPDQQDISDLIKKLDEIYNQNNAKQLVAEGPDKSMLHRALLTYLGIVQSFDTPMNFSDITMTNSMFNDVAWLQIIIRVDVL